MEKVLNTLTKMYIICSGEAFAVYNDSFKMLSVHSSQLQSVQVRFWPILLLLSPLWVALLLRAAWGETMNPTCMCGVHMLLPIQKHAGRLTGVSELPIVCACMCPAMDWPHIWNVPWPCALYSIGSRTYPWPPWPGKAVRRWMDGWINEWMDLIILTE